MRRVRLLIPLVAALGGGLGCSLPQGGSGDKCVRSAECADGLACVEGVCSANLQAIADQSMPADLGMRDAAVDAATDAAIDGGTGLGTDASAPGVDTGGAGGSGGADAMSPDVDAAISGEDAG